MRDTDTKNPAAGRKFTICYTNDPVSSVVSMGQKIDWRAVKRELLDLRKAKSDKQARFSRTAKLQRNTVVRIERGVDSDEAVRWETLQQWLDATSGESIGDFLTRVAKKQKFSAAATSSVTPASDTVPVVPPPPQPGEAASDHGSAIVSGFGISDAQDAKLLKSLAFTIIRAANALRDHGAVRSDDAGASDRRDTPADGRGSDDAPGLSRVK